MRVAGLEIINRTIAAAFALTLLAPYGAAAAYPEHAIRLVVPFAPGGSTDALARPGALRYGSQGIGTSAHVFGDLMSSMAGVKVISVPYKGGGPALTGVLVGEVDYAMIAVSTALAQVNAGKLRALGVTSAR